MAVSALLYRNNQAPARSLSPGGGTAMPSSVYCFNLLRSVRIEMPRILAAWVAGGAQNLINGLPMGRLQSIFMRGDIALALGVVTILAVLILPMPTWLLDLSLGISITFSILILMTVLFINRALDFNAFPTVLLIATMMRLSLNLASTRLILAEGHTGTDAAGPVRQAFGQFLMSGNAGIGVIVFARLVIVNFIVITKGSAGSPRFRRALTRTPCRASKWPSTPTCPPVDRRKRGRARREFEPRPVFRS